MTHQSAVSASDSGMPPTDTTQTIPPSFFSSSVPSSLADNADFASSTDGGTASVDYLAWSHDNFTCNQYVRENNTFVVYGGYEGVPMNLAANLLGWTLLILLFSVLRKRAWNYGRLALVHKNERRWTQLFYGSGQFGPLVGHTLTTVESAPSHVDPAPSQSGSAHNSDAATRASPPPESLQMGDVVLDRGVFSWIKAVFSISDDDLLRKCGQDSVQYVSFQRHIIFYLATLTALSLGLVLPVNYLGGDIDASATTAASDGRQSFQLTTVANLAPDSRWLWLHVSLGMLLLPLAIAVMRRFSSRLNRAAAACAVNVSGGGDGVGGGCVERTLIITNIPRVGCNRNTVVKHFHEAYPSCRLVDVQFAYNISRLMWLDSRRDAMSHALRHCHRQEATTGRRPTVRPHLCGNIGCCCSALGLCAKVDAIEHYSREESRLARHVEIEKAVALNQPLGIAFVVFASQSMAARVVREHDHVLRCGQPPPHSSVSTLLRPHRWQVRFAPPPHDIYWQNLSHSSVLWYVRSVLVNVLLFITLFFLTTPIIVANAVEKLWITNQVKATSPLVSEFLPTLLLWTLAALMPVIVSYSDRFIYHWTRSSENYSIMTKTFIFLLFMVVILPSLGLSSVRALVEWVARPIRETRWNCVFLPDNGAFFVNYVITSAFIGTALEIIRFPELFMYAFRMCLARSQAEVVSVRSAILWEFPFGVQYGWMLLIFAVTVIYSLLSPLIAPFGLVYMVLKHLVDRHNIYYAYGASRIKRRIHTTAINFVMLSVLMTQLCLCLLTYSRQGMSSLTVFALFGLSVTLAMSLAHMLFNWFTQCSPVQYADMTDYVMTSEQSADSCDSAATVNVDIVGGEAFVPNVLLRAPQVQVRDTGDVFSYPTAAQSFSSTATTMMSDGGAASGGVWWRRQSYGANNDGHISSATTNNQHTDTVQQPHSSGLYQNYQQTQPHSEAGSDVVLFTDTSASESRNNNSNINNDL